MKKIKLGFLTVQGEEENHSQMMGGVFDAAVKFDVHVIRFSVHAFYEDYGKYSTELHHLYKVIEAQELDGLMFLGWMPGVVGIFFEDFLKRFSYMPVVSIGADYPHVPNIFADPEEILTELLEHLILKHGHKNIIFVPPSLRDIRSDIYKDVMQRHGLFREDLLIRGEALLNIPFKDRMSAFLATMIDERKINIDAIIVSFDTDAQYLYKELQLRGINIPEDIAVASSEDTEFAKYSLPPLTVVTFPWREVGYHGCEKLVSLIRHQTVENSTGISGKLIIRNSCGCRSDSVKLSKIENHQGKNASHGTVDIKQILLFSEQMKKAFPDTLLHIDSLLLSLEKDFAEDVTTHFQQEFEDQLQIIVNRYPFRDNIEDVEIVIYALRNRIIPVIASQCKKMILFEDIIHKAIIMIREEFEFIIGYDNIEMKAINHDLHLLSQELGSALSIKKLIRALEQNLYRFQIKSCYVFLSTKSTFDEFLWVMNYKNGKRCSMEERIVSLRYFSEEIVNKHQKLLCQLLHTEDEYLGFVVYEPTILDARIYETLTLHMSSALHSALLLEKLSGEIALRKEKEIQLRHYANYDSLTDLYNRRYFYKTIQYLLDRDAKFPDEKLHFYLLFIDFDDFKQVNDIFGHDVGDLLIIEIAQQFKNLIRQYTYHIPDEMYSDDQNGMSEAIFRLGGDEFTAIIYGVSMEEIKAMATELIKIVKDPHTIEGNEINISCSVGICIYPDHADTAEMLIKRADQAMYLAKQVKNRYCFYEDLM